MLAVARSRPRATTARIRELGTLHHRRPGVTTGWPEPVYLLSGDERFTSEVGIGSQAGQRLGQQRLQVRARSAQPLLVRRHAAGEGLVGEQLAAEVLRRPPGAG